MSRRMDRRQFVLTGAADVKTAIDSLKFGAYDFIMKPVNVDELVIAADRALERRQLLIERREYQTYLELRVEEATRDLQAAYRQLQDTYKSTLEALGSALDTRDVGTESHSRRVHGYSMATAREYGVPEDQLIDIAHGVLLHDIGKIGIPDAILLKPGPLTPDEWKIMRRHPEIGRRLIENIPFLREAVQEQPGNVTALRLLAEQKYKAGDHRTALGLDQRVVPIEHGAVVGLHPLGDAAEPAGAG